MRVDEQLGLTAEELFYLDRDEPCELWDGEVRPMSPAGWDHGRIANRIAFLLTRHLERHKIGRVLACETGYLLSRHPDTVLAPDVSFVRADRVPQGRHPSYLPLAPDLAVEVVSPTQSQASIDEKTARWLASGLRMLWVVWPDSRTVVVHRPGQASRELRETDRIEGGDVLPGFESIVSDFFE